MSTANGRPPFDPEVEAAMTALGGELVQGLTADQIPELRRRLPPPDLGPLAVDDRFELSEHPVVHERAEVTMLLARPVAVTGPIPVLYHLHGGGLVTGSAYEDLPALLELAARTGTAVAALEYRLAPEWPYPAALEDAYAGLVWLTGQGTGLGLDATRVVITGVSAGGGLAAATALLARDRGGPELAGQMLVYPMLDDRNNSPSAVQMAGAGTWDRTANATAWRAYLGDRAGGGDVTAHEAPARATDLSDLPPTFVDVGSAETFRDEDIAFATRLWRHGGEAELHVWPGGCHGFDFLVPEATVSREARAARVRWLLRLLARPAGA